MKIKTFLMILLILIVFATCGVHVKAETNVMSNSDFTGGLSLDPGVIEQRENKNGQTTNELEVEILTSESEKIENGIDEYENKHVNDILNEVFTNKYEIAEDGSLITSYEFFEGKEEYYAQNNVDSNGDVHKVIIYCIVAIGVSFISYASVRVYRKSKKR